MTSAPQSPLALEEALPQYYEEDRLVLLPRDPYSLYAYWEISTSYRDSLKNDWGEEAWQNSAPVLRVYKHRWSQQGIIDSVTEINLEPEANNWYISVNSPDHFYHAELGLRRREGTFSPLLCSNLVRTPRDAISDLIDENWKLPDWKSRKLFRRISVCHLSSPEFIRHSPKK